MERSKDKGQIKREVFHKRGNIYSVHVVSDDCDYRVRARNRHSRNSHGLSVGHSAQWAAHVGGHLAVRRTVGSGEALQRRQFVL